MNCEWLDSLQDLHLTYQALISEHNFTRNQAASFTLSYTEGLVQ